MIDSGGKIAGKKLRADGPSGIREEQHAGSNISEGWNLKSCTVKRPSPRCRLCFQGHDVLFQCIRNNVSELFQIQEHISSKTEYLLGFLLPFA